METVNWQTPKGILTTLIAGIAAGAVGGTLPASTPLWAYFPIGAAIATVVILTAIHTGWIKS